MHHRNVVGLASRGKLEGNEGVLFLGPEFLESLLWGRVSALDYWGAQLGSAATSPPKCKNANAVWLGGVPKSH